jgi:hypothetical protein
MDRFSGFAVARHALSAAAAMAWQPPTIWRAIMG